MLVRNGPCWRSEWILMLKVSYILNVHFNKRAWTELDIFEKHSTDSQPHSLNDFIIWVILCSCVQISQSVSSLGEIQIGNSGGLWIPRIQEKLEQGLYCGMEVPYCGTAGKSWRAAFCEDLEGSRYRWLGRVKPEMLVVELHCETVLSSSCAFRPLISICDETFSQQL